MANFDENDPSLKKHFELAGIVDDPPAGSDTQTATDSGDQGGAETTAGPDTQAATTTADKQEATGRDILTGEQSKPAEQNKPGGAADSKTEQGQAPKGQESAPSKDLKLTDGSIVKGGAERRWYERYESRGHELTLAKNQINNFNQQLANKDKELNDFRTAAQAVGLENPTVMSDAVRLYKDLASDPVNTVTKLLAELKKAGHNIDGLGSNLDAALIKELNQKIDNPSSVQGKTQEELQQEQIVEDAKTEVSNFFQAFPDARLHDRVLGRIIAEHPDTPLSEAYGRLKLLAQEQGLDWSRDLEVQMQERAAAGKGQQTQTAVVPPKPMIGGKGADVIVDTAQDFDPTKVVTQSDSIEDAIIAGMRDAGIEYRR